MKKTRRTPPTYLAASKNTWQRVKSLAALRGVKIRDLVDELLMKAIAKAPEARQINAAIKPVEK